MRTALIAFTVCVFSFTTILAFSESGPMSFVMAGCSGLNLLWVIAAVRMPSIKPTTSPDAEYDFMPPCHFCGGHVSPDAVTLCCHKCAKRMLTV